MLNRWKVEDSSDGSVLAPAAAPLPHSYWVTGVSSLSPNSHPQFPGGLVVCGARDNLIRLYDMQGNLVKCLTGHEKPPVSFSWTQDFRLVSGAWDGSARVWDLVSGECTLTLGGHENLVNVLCLTENETSQPNLLATVSTGESVNSKPANFKLRIWSLATGQQVVTPIEDHAGSIRSIFRIPGTGFATTSNDGSVLVRSSLDSGGGGSVSTFLHPPQAGGEGFPPFILGGSAVDLSLMTSNPMEKTGFVSCGEDGSVVVWKGTEMEQVLSHPSSVWAVCSLPPPNSSPKGSASAGWYGGDIATAGHDGVLRVFSCDPDRTSKPLSLALQADLDRDVEEALARLNKGPSSEEIAAAPKWEERGGLPGTSEAQVRVFNKSGTAIAAQWSSDSGSWVEIGEVTGQGNSGDGGEVHGVVYDHVMPVEIETAQGLVTLQLGYNELENPFVSAQRFIDQNSLDQNYLSQIADFITARAGRSAAPTFDMSQPTASSSSSSSSHPMEVVASGQGNGGNNKRPRHNYTLLPLKVYFSYEDIPSGLQSKFMTKIRDFNTAFSASSDGTKGVLSEDEFGVIDATLGVLADTSHYHSSRVPKNIYSVLHTMLTHWTDGKTLFPSFDLLRMISAHPSGSQQLAASPYLSAMLSKAANVVSQDFGGSTSTLTNSSSPMSSPQALTALRFLATTCRHTTLRQKVLGLMLTPTDDGNFSGFSSMIGSLSALTTSSNIKAVHRHALSSWCANVLVACFAETNSQVTPETIALVLGIYYPSVVFLLDKEPENVDVVVRCLLAVGTVAVSEFIPEESRSDLLASSTCDDVLTKIQERWVGRSDYLDLCMAEACEAAFS